MEVENKSEAHGLSESGLFSATTTTILILIDALLSCSQHT